MFGSGKSVIRRLYILWTTKRNAEGHNGMVQGFWTCKIFKHVMKISKRSNRYLLLFNMRCHMMKIFLFWYIPYRAMKYSWAIKDRPIFCGYKYAIYWNTIQCHVFEIFKDKNLLAYEPTCHIFWSILMESRNTCHYWWIWQTMDMNKWMVERYRWRINGYLMWNNLCVIKDTKYWTC